MSRLTYRGYSDVEAAEFAERANGPHTVQWKANVRWWFGGESILLYEALPITGGTLRLDSSDPIRRHLTLDVAGIGQLVPDASSDPLAPFGQFVILFVRIDRHDGSWFDWMKMGEYPIQTTTSEWPSMIQTIECADWSQVVDDYLHEKKRTLHKQSVHTAIQHLTEAALPDKVFTIYSSADAKSTQVHPNTTAEAGQSRWETAVQVAQDRGFECFFQSTGDLVIREDLTNDDEDTIPAIGPDIGTVSNPVATIRDKQGGNLVALTSAVTREGATNGVFINLHETASQTLRRHGRKVSGDKRVNVTVRALGTGAIAWGDRYGRQPIVMERAVKVITDEVVARQTRRAKRLLHRRGGVVRTLDLDAVGLYWLEPDDRIRVQYDGRTEYHFVQSIDLDLAGKSPARIRTRSLTTKDPG